MFPYMCECDGNGGLHYLTLTPYVTLRKEKEINYTPIGMYWMRRGGGESTHQAMVQTRRPEKSQCLAAWMPAMGRENGHFHRPIHVRRAEAPVPQTDLCAPCRSTHFKPQKK